MWLRSPFTGDAYTACFVRSSGFVDTFSSGEVDIYSYGRKDRRVQATTTVRGACGQVVVSTAITASKIPTDKLRRTRTTHTMLGLSTHLVTFPSEASTVSRIPTVFFSPSTHVDYFAWYVITSGDTKYNYNNGTYASYGLFQIYSGL